MNIRSLLELSTAHLPQHLGDQDSETALDAQTGVVAHLIEHGWLLWVPTDPQETADSYPDEKDAVPAEVLAIQLYARANHCDYVLFDRDADVDDNLPTWEW